MTVPHTRRATLVETTKGIIYISSFSLAPRSTCQNIGKYAPYCAARPRDSPAGRQLSPSDSRDTSVSQPEITYRLAPPPLRLANQFTAKAPEDCKFKCKLQDGDDGFPGNSRGAGGGGWFQRSAHASVNIPLLYWAVGFWAWDSIRSIILFWEVE